MQEYIFLSRKRYLTAMQDVVRFWTTDHPCDARARLAYFNWDDINRHRRIVHADAMIYTSAFALNEKTQQPYVVGSDHVHSIEQKFSHFLCEVGKSISEPDTTKTIDSIENHGILSWVYPSTNSVQLVTFG